MIAMVAVVRVLECTLALTAATTTAPARAQAFPALRVHLVGTGGPEPTPDRQGHATLVEAPGLPDDVGLTLFDARRGVFQRLYERRIDPRRMTRVAPTRLHSDHHGDAVDVGVRITDSKSTPF